MTTPAKSVPGMLTTTTRLYQLDLEPGSAL
jgi:hypothetical protein